MKRVKDALKGMRVDISNLIDKRSLENSLPKVGDELYEIPTVHVWLTSDETIEPQLCKVIYVNKEKLWYIVEFDILGRKFRETYSIIPGKRTYDKIVNWRSL